MNHFASPRHPRPAALFLLLPLLAAVLLSSCHSSGRTVQAQLQMEVQYYDVYGNYIEIPTVTLSGDPEPGPDLDAMNNELSSIATLYTHVLLEEQAAPALDGSKCVCLLYPTITDRFVSLLLFQKWSVSGQTSGHVSSFAFDLERRKQVSLPDVLDQTGLTESGLCEELIAQMDPPFQQSLPQELRDLDVHVCRPVLEGFRIRPDGEPVFYLTARLGDVDRDRRDPLIGSDQIYVWEDGVFTRYDQYASDGFPPLVPFEECTELDPPLWFQWNFTGGEPQGGFTGPEP